VRFLDEITENVLRSYKKYMVGQNYAGKTIDTRLNITFFLLKKRTESRPEFHETRCQWLRRKLQCRIRMKN
jgi:hypothetical protein